MKILYVASDQRVPGTTGGSVHVEEVAEGLVGRGHDVHVVALPEKGSSDYSFAVHEAQMLVPHRFFRWTARRGIDALIDRTKPDVVMERYYNFGGEGVRSAHCRGIPSVLEVNAPMREPEGSRKARLDKFLLVEPMRRLREAQHRKAAALVTPLVSILPEDIPPEKIHKVHWGANVNRFQPGVGRIGTSFPEDARVVVFSSSFRPWHGADVLVRAARHVLSAAPDDNVQFLFIGDGPAAPEARQLARRLGIARHVFMPGAVSYREMPHYLALGALGVAPYQPSRLPQMRLGFFWSPLKIFEYMAMALPVVTLDVEPLREIVRPGQDGLLVAEDDADALGEAIVSLLQDPERSKAMGASGRQRVVDHFSWERHCEQLEEVLRSVVANR